MPSLHSSPAKTRCAAVRMAQTGSDGASGVSGAAAAAAIEGPGVFLTESWERERSRVESTFRSRASSPLHGSILAFIRSRLSDGPESLADRRSHHRIEPRSSKGLQLNACCCTAFACDGRSGDADVKIDKLIPTREMQVAIHVPKWSYVADAAPQNSRKWHIWTTN